MTPEEALIEREKKLISYEGPDRVVHYADYLALKAEENKKYRPLFCGFKEFDEKLGGIQTGEVTVITGHTGQGKTLFAESLVHRMMIQPFPVNTCFFSFEVAAHQVVQKYEDSPHPLYVPLALQAMNYEWLADRILEAKLKYDCRVFVLDHLHFLIDMATIQNMSLNIGGFMRRLKFEIAGQMNVAVLLIAHQDKGDKKEDASLEGIRDSTFISQEADNVIVISRRKDFTMTEMESMSAEAKEKISVRMGGLPDVANPFSRGLAMAQIAKARRTGTFRWSKLFQKVGNFMEEI